MRVGSGSSNDLSCCCFSGFFRVRGFRLVRLHAEKLVLNFAYLFAQKGRFVAFEYFDLGHCFWFEIPQNVFCEEVAARFLLTLVKVAAILPNLSSDLFKYHIAFFCYRNACLSSVRGAGSCWRFVRRCFGKITWLRCYWKSYLVRWAILKFEFFFDFLWWFCAVSWAMSN